MFEIFLIFSDRAEAEAVLADVGIMATGEAFPCDGWTARGNKFALDVLFGTGIIHAPTGERVTFEDETIDLQQPVPGFHLNMLWEGEIPEELSPFRIFPQTPACRFAL